VRPALVRDSHFAAAVTCNLITPRRSLRPWDAASMRRDPSWRVVRRSCWRAA